MIEGSVLHSLMGYTTHNYIYYSGFGKIQFQEQTWLAFKKGEVSSSFDRGPLLNDLSYHFQKFFDAVRFL